MLEFLTSPIIKFEIVHFIAELASIKTDKEKALYLEMIACQTFQVKLNKTFNKILYLSTALDDTFAFLAVVSTGRDAIYHCDRFGKILYQYKFQHPVDSFMMMNTQEVIILYPKENKIYVFNLPQKKYYQCNHQFMNQESDLSQIYGFSQTTTICVKEKGKHHDHRLYLTYYQYPIKSDAKKICKYESIDNQWTTDMLIFKGNNHSMVIWCKQRNDEEIDVRMFHRRAQPQGTYKQYRFKNQLVTYYNISKIETSINYAFELRQNNILLVCFSNKSDCRVINKDGVVNNNFILNTQIPQTPFLCESKFYFQKDFNHYLIDYRNLGSYSMFRTYDYKNRVAQLSPIYYIDNMTEQIVCKEYWRCSYLHKYFIPGYTSNCIVQAMHQNGHVDNFIVHCKRILSPSAGVTGLLQEIKIKLDENLLTDVYDLLQGQ